MSRCKATVWGERVQSWRCLRNAVRDGYCAQHHPDAQAARDKASASRYAAKEHQREHNAKRSDLRAVVAWLTKVAPASGLTRRAKAELEKLEASHVV